MQRIMIVDRDRNHGEKLMEVLGQEYEVIQARSGEEAKQFLAGGLRDSINLVLVDTQTAEVGGIAFLEYLYSRKPLEQMAVVSITEDIRGAAMEECYRLGVKEFWTFDMPIALLKEKIEQMKEKQHSISYLLREWGDFQPDYFFTECIGAALILEYDGERLLPIMINDAFYTTTNKDPDAFSQYKDNLIVSVLKEEIGAFQTAVRESLQNGVGICQMRNGESGQVFRVVMRRIGQKGHKILFFVTLDDVTDTLKTIMKVQAITELPGTWLFDYDPMTDQMIVSISSHKGVRNIIQKGMMTEGKYPSWLSPESVKSFRDTCAGALAQPSSGYLDFRAKLASKKFLWYRSYYRSIGDSTGRVFRVVGRMEELDEFSKVKSPFNNARIYDETTRLLTYQALKEFISKRLGENKKGTMFVVAIENLEKLVEEQGKEKSDEILRQVTKRICKLFRESDIIGRFGAEGFVIFLPEACSEGLAKRKACEILEVLDQSELVYEASQGKAQVNIGVAMAGRGNMEVGDLLQRANAARWKAKDYGQERYEIDTYGFSPESKD